MVTISAGPQTSGSRKGSRKGCEPRTRGSSFTCWLPQVAILAHASIGTFLSHYGWNSVLESTAHGVPVVAWPLNVQVLEEWGSCVELCRGNVPDSPALERERVAEVVEMVIGSMEMAAKTRQCVKKIQEMIAPALEDGGSSMDTLKEFFALLMLRDRTMPMKL
ncbi:hypothetical protein OsI_15150 [Oryza sativa Indica Group]|uniref:UDP-glycosyltransferases domain-containing protein n=1 Tax=Oryza sativa subsp. indica TaxID=39946 RepID=B8ARL0_ORYSI|nr:hypothetical protein OsI_15150 [Oryza sativa Indica Group]